MRHAIAIALCALLVAACKTDGNPFDNKVTVTVTQETHVDANAEATGGQSSSQSEADANAEATGGGSQSEASADELYGASTKDDSSTASDNPANDPVVDDDPAGDPIATDNDPANDPVVTDTDAQTLTRTAHDLGWWNAITEFAVWNAAIENFHVGPTHTPPTGLTFAGTIPTTPTTGTATWTGDVDGVLEPGRRALADPNTPPRIVFTYDFAAHHTASQTQGYQDGGSVSDVLRARVDWLQADDPRWRTVKSWAVIAVAQDGTFETASGNVGDLPGPELSGAFYGTAHESISGEVNSARIVGTFDARKQ